MNYKVEFIKTAEKEYLALDNSQRMIIAKGIKKIMRLGTKAGVPLKGDLKGCYKIKARKAGLRIVYCQKDNAIEIMQIISIGKRDKLQVYLNASKRVKK